MGKIYIVTSGEYSDYGINIVTTNKEIAELYCKNHSTDFFGDTLQIEEFEDYDDLVSEQNEFNTKEMAYRYSFNNGKAYWNRFYEDKNKKTRIVKFDIKYDTCIIIVHNEDETKAFKIACDMRAKKMAELMGL